MYFRYALVSALMATMLLSGLAVAQSTGQVDGRLETIDIKTPEAYQSTFAPLYWRQEIRRIGSGYLRLKLSVSGVKETSKLMLEIEGTSGKVIEYTADDLEGDKTFWSPIIFGDRAVVSLFSESVPTTEHLAIETIAVQHNSGSLLSTWGGVDEKEHINAPGASQLSRDLKNPVAWISYISEGKPRVCSGFLVAQDRLVTNNHCIATDAECLTATVVFGFEIDIEGELQLGQQYQCSDLMEQRSSPSLDYSVLQLDGDPSMRWKEVAFADADPDTNEELLIIQHPAGEPKQVSEINCRVLNASVEGGAPMSDFSHSCDTVTGSSGSPVFNKNGQVVGLHHYGFAEDSSGNGAENRAVRASLLINILAQ